MDIREHAQGAARSRTSPDPEDSRGCSEPCDEGWEVAVCLEKSFATQHPCLGDDIMAFAVAMFVQKTTGGKKLRIM